MKNYCENCKYKQLLHAPDINGEVFTKCNICLKSLECLANYGLYEIQSCDCFLWDIDHHIENCKFYKRKWWKFWVK